jgi:23S rRNA (pseudouridine1915-N3)-methyltransferase
VKIYVYYIGKTRDQHANGMAGEYIKRTTRYLHCEMREIQPNRFDVFAKQASSTKVLLDPEGVSINSARFTALIAKAELDARDLVFVVGGADGLPPEWKPRADLLLSLSPMTFPHELARAMLAEQIYRAVTGMRGHPYPR